MESKGFHRKLAVILSADVASYSRLMQDDEAATVKTLEAYKQIISDLVKQHRGRVVDSPGDDFLAEFASVVDAVQCSVATQKELQARNTELSENRKMQFRIGVNLGDVIEEESRIYGDGVNISADPKLANYRIGDYHLQPTSPCIDAGDGATPGLPTTDIDGNTRPKDGNYDGIAKFDIGAYVAKVGGLAEH